MTIWEIITVGPLWLFVMGVIAAPLIPVANRHGAEWAKNLVLAIAFAGATAAVWVVTNSGPLAGGSGGAGYAAGDF